MPRVEIHLPAMLASAVGEAVLHVEADTLAGALAAFRREHPRAATHVFDDAGVQRRHVLIFFNEQDTRWTNGQTIVSGGDRLSIVQAISGG